MFCHILWLCLLLATCTAFANKPDGQIVSAPRPAKKNDRTNPWNDPFVQRLHDNIDRQGDLDQESSQEQKLTEEYRRRGIDPIWASRAVRDVHTRCTVINFKNGGMLARQIIPPSPLPEHFKDDFSPIPIIRHLVVRNRSPEEFMRKFGKKLWDKNIAHRYAQAAPYGRAAMREWGLYGYPNFRAFMRGLCMYEEYMPEIAAQLRHDHEFAQRVGEACAEAPIYIRSEGQRIQEKLRMETEARRRDEEQQAQQRRVQQELFSQQMQVQKTYSAQVSELASEEGEWHELEDLYGLYQCGDPAHLEKRIAALQAIKDSGMVYGSNSYRLSEAAGNLLEKHCYAKEPYAICYGNQLQQAIHQECIDLLGQAANLPDSLPMCITPGVMVDCIEAVREYNQAGFVSKASGTADLCYAMLEYAKQVATKIVSGAAQYGGAVIEGGVQGLIIAGQDIIDHPVQFVLCAVAGEYVLAYQLSKVAWKVLDLAVTAAIDPPKAQATWDEYLASINGIIDAITNQEVTLCDAVKAGTALAVCWKAQSKLLTGCNKLCSGVRSRAVEYIKANSLATPEQYLATPDGVILKNSRENMLLRSTEHSSINNLSSREIDANAVYKRVKGSNERCRLIGPLDEQKAWDWAEQEYNRIRELKDDIEKISQNINVPKFQIERIKKHLFYNNHVLDSRIGRLDADPEIARAWNRLYMGDFIKNDIRLLNHEYFESKFELLYKTTLRRAHEAAQSSKGRPWMVPPYED